MDKERALGMEREFNFYERNLERPTCEECGGQRVRKLSRTIECINCDGRGYTTNKEIRAEEICRRCKGDGQLRQSRKVSCQACDSKGYLVRVVDVYRREIQSRISCEDCEGTGYFTIERQCECIDEEEAVEKQNFMRLVEDDDYEDDGEMMEESSASQCYSCSECDGRGFVEVKEICQTCSGRGILREEKYEYRKKSIR